MSKKKKVEYITTKYVDNYFKIHYIDSKLTIHVCIYLQNKIHLRYLAFFNIILFKINYALVIKK